MPNADSSRSLYPLFTINLVSTLGFSLVAPFLVTLITRLGGNALVYGAVGATYSFFQLFGAPLIGRWSDSVGRRRALLLCQVGTLIAWIVFLVGMSLPDHSLVSTTSGLLGTFVITLPVAAIFFSRALDGLTGGDASVAKAYLADLSPPEHLSNNFGKMAVASSLGLIVGPTFGGLLGATRFGETPAILGAMAISAVAVILIAFFLPESAASAAPTVHRGHEHVSKVFGHGHAEAVRLKEEARLGVRGILAIPEIGYLLALQLIVFLAYNVFFAAFPVYVTTKLGWGSHHVGFFFSFLGLVTVIVQGPVLGWLTPRVSGGRLVVAGSIILSGSFLFFDDPVMSTQYVGAALFALGNGLLWPALSALVATHAGARYQGAVQGLSGSVASLASIVGLLAGGVLFNVMERQIFPLVAGLVVSVTRLSRRHARSGVTPGTGEGEGDSRAQSPATVSP